MKFLLLLVVVILPIYCRVDEVAIQYTDFVTTYEIYGDVSRIELHTNVPVNLTIYRQGEKIIHRQGVMFDLCRDILNEHKTCRDLCHYKLILTVIYNRVGDEWNIKVPTAWIKTIVRDDTYVHKIYTYISNKIYNILF